MDVLSVIRSEIPAPAGNRRSSRLGSKIKNSFRFSDAVRALLRFQVLGPKRATEQMARLVLNYFKVMQREDTRRPQESVPGVICTFGYGNAIAQGLHCSEAVGLHQ